MKKLFLHITITILCILVFTSFENSTENYTLFKIGRTKDANEIFYTVQLDNKGNLDSENPISVFWLKRTEGNKTEPLTWIQRKYAYGIKIIEETDTYAKFQFVSYNKRTFLLKKNQQGEFKVYTLSENKIVEVNKIYIHLDGGSFWFPVISQVDLIALNPLTNENVIEVIKP